VVQTDDRPRLIALQDVGQLGQPLIVIDGGVLVRVEPQRGQTARRLLVGCRVYVVAAVICGLLIRPQTYAHHHTGAELGDEAILMNG
jgi:hypothetical protein